MTSNRDQFQALAEYLSAFAKEELALLPPTFESPSVKFVFEPYKRLLEFCLTAPDQVRDSINNLADTVHPRHAASVARLEAQGATRPAAFLRDTINADVDRLLPGGAGESADRGRTDVRKAKVASQQENLMRIVEAGGGLILGTLHQAIEVASHLLEIARGARGIAAGSKRTYQELSERLVNLDRTQRALKDMCAMLLLIRKPPGEEMMDMKTAGEMVEAELAKIPS